MSNTQNPARGKLPVTAEVGGEGGSFADATQQAETFKGAAGNPRLDPKTVVRPEGDLAAAASEGEQVLDTGELVKHATEAPGKS